MVYKFIVEIFKIYVVMIYFYCYYYDNYKKIKINLILLNNLLIIIINSNFCYWYGVEIGY